MVLIYDAQILQNGNVSCRIVSDTYLFICKIRVPAVSMACPCRIHGVSGNHRFWLLCSHSNSSVTLTLQLHLFIMASYLQKHVQMLLSFFFCHIVPTCTNHPITIWFPDWNVTCIGICIVWHLHNLRVQSLVDAELYKAQPEISLQFVEAKYSISTKFSKTPPFPPLFFFFFFCHGAYESI